MMKEARHGADEKDHGDPAGHELGPGRLDQGGPHGKGNGDGDGERRATQTHGQ